MTGLSGWQLDSPGSVEAELVAARMSACLPGSGKCQTFLGQQMVLTCRLDSESAETDHKNGIFVAIEGAPRWLAQDVSNVAKDRGHGAALLYAYQSLGTELLNKLTGTFALAILDQQRQQVVLAIDRMGIRPMCYAELEDSGIVFGTTADAVLAHGQVNATISPQSIYHFIYFHVVPSPRTIYESVRKLEPAECLIYKDGTVRKRKYWRPEFVTETNSTKRELGNELMCTLRGAIGRTSLDRDTGAFLSGGLDSSTVCGLANEYIDRPLSAYTIGFAQQGYDETEFARNAAAHFGLDLHEYMVTVEDVVEAIPIIATACDEPFGNSSAIPTYFCARLAAGDGVQHLLAGDGGDELFAGNERYATQELFDYYSKIPASIRKKLIEPTVLGIPLDWSFVTRKLRRYVEQARIPMPERLQTYNYLHMNRPTTVFEESFLDRVDDQTPIYDMNTWYCDNGAIDPLNRMLLFDWKLTLADNDIRKVNRMCEIAGVKVEYPLMDDELVQFSTQIPSALKLRNGQLRYFYKNSLNEFLPTETIKKKKHGFGLPVGEWLRSSAQLQDAVFPVVRQLSDRGIFRRDFIEDLISRNQIEHAAYYGNIIWVLLMLESWLRARESVNGV